MNNYSFAFLLTILVGLSTMIGTVVIFIKRYNHNKIVLSSLAFAAGVMIAASVWSLLIPAIDMTEAQGGIGWLPALVGFLLGIGFLLNEGEE
mgnify:CR=1 FL=1